MNIAWKRFDQIGFSVSFICAIHCLAMPILLPLIPVLGSSFIASESAELVIVSITLLIATPTLFRGYLKHRKLLIPGCFLVGLLLFAFRPGAFEHSHQHFHGEDILHFVFAALAGFSLALAHWLNLSFCRICPTCKDEESSCK